ncbi:glycoside hydrolase superfamily [Chytriomyces sp. MP71]|nr:glycoside hydrolase superfamily [Chytriomyces sp. MP71]
MHSATSFLESSLILVILAASVQTAQTSATFSATTAISVNTSNVLVKQWQGFGTSLSWWAVAVGASQLESELADALYSTNEHVGMLINGTTIHVPGLGLNVVRYNIGGTGEDGDYPGTVETFKDSSSRSGLDWWKLVPGFWTDGSSSDPMNWDWTRDQNQRSMLNAIHKRGAQYIELYSNAPMWWMTEENSSLGGTILSNRLSEFVTYISTVVSHARLYWSIPVTSVSILNEPSGAPTSTYGTATNEALYFPFALEQAKLYSSLRSNLSNQFSTSTVVVSGADDRSIALASLNLNTVLPQVDQYNVHGYLSTDANRTSLRTSVGSKTLWMSQYDDTDDSGLKLATAILKDLAKLRPSAWVYHQALSLTSEQTGVILSSTFGAGPFDPARGQLVRVTTKFYILAQFTRYLRPGDEIISTSSSSSIAAINSSTGRVKVIVVGYLASQTVSIDVSQQAVSDGTKLLGRYTKTDGSVLFEEFEVVARGGKAVFTMERKGVYSLEF